ncbi:hypothetical protein ACSC9T_11755 [Pseudomonas putida]|uniref:hypothetical protein n=1 Tax=Pseudomonas putida TaxID=303 RepID=UPI0023634C4D|nr:hypothetical protein [Pseudomonas putida]MDD2141743.1 hypothetical protein [Pseudomonas putida]HDS1726975.1 hypothetical protein [Pseudomonas putida]
MSLIGDILSAIKFATDILAKKDSDRDKVADLIHHIAELIEVIVDEYKSEKGISPARFSEFSYYCSSFSEIAKSALSPETHSRIDKLLKYTREADRRRYIVIEGYKSVKRDQSLTGESMAVSLLDKLTAPSTSSNELKKTLEIAGELRAIANHMKISKRKI